MGEEGRGSIFCFGMLVKVWAHWISTGLCPSHYTGSSCTQLMGRIYCWLAWLTDYLEISNTKTVTKCVKSTYTLFHLELPIAETGNTTT